MLMPHATNIKWVRCVLLILALIIGCGGTPGLWASGVGVGPNHEEDHHELTVSIDSIPYAFVPGDPANETTRILATIQYPFDTQGGVVAWELAIYAPDHTLVRSYYGSDYLAPAATVTLTQAWDGRDGAGRVLPKGEYAYEITVHYGSGLPSALKWVSYELAPLLFEHRETSGARGHLRIQSDDEARAARQNLKNKWNSMLLAEPLDPQFWMNFYYGNFHSQSNFSDGGWALSGAGLCNLPESRLCQGEFSPAESFQYARDSGYLNFLAVTDHNHLFDCSSYYSASVPYTCRMDPAAVRKKYQQGLSLAQAMTEEGVFVALYGQEFGVTTQPTDGHIGVLESPVLFNWEEHADGSCYDVYVGRSAYTDLYSEMVNYPSPWGPIGILNHPGGWREFNYYEMSEAAREAIVGLEVTNGPAFADSDTMSCNGARYDGDSVFCLPDCRPACTLACNLSQHQYMWALNKGFRVAPFASQDNHRNNFGSSTASRTVVMANALTKDEILYALRQRHVFATSRDPDAQLVFITADGANMMGDAFIAQSPVSFYTSVLHPDGRDILQELRVYIGYPGTTRTPSLAHTSSGSPYTFTLTFTPGHYYVFIYVKQTDGSELWSAPMWLAVE